MQTNLILAAALSALAVPGIAAPLETPYSLSAVHADFQEQLNLLAGRPGEVGDAARAAAGLMGPHNARQERLVLPLLGSAEAATTGWSAGRLNGSDQSRLQADIAQLYDGDVDLVTALVDLYAAAEGVADAETARIAERMIWHETGDAEVLYPAAARLASSMTAQDPGVDRANMRVGQGPLLGVGPMPMMGVGDPHRAGAGN